MEPGLRRLRAEPREHHVDERGEPIAHRSVDPVLRRARERGGCLEHAEHNRQEDEDAEHRVQQHAVDAVRERHTVARVGAQAVQHAHRPVEAFVGAVFDPALHIHMLQVDGFEAFGQRRAVQMGGHRVHELAAAFARAPVDRYDGHAAQCTRQQRGVDAGALLGGQVVHRQGHHGGAAEFEHHRQEVQGTRDVRGVEHCHDEVRGGFAVEPHHRFGGHAFVGGERQQRIGARRVDEVPLHAVVGVHALFEQHGGAGGVHDARLGAQQCVEQR